MAAAGVGDDPRWPRALRLVDEGRCPAALGLLEGITAERPDAAEAWLARGRCELRLRRYPDARASLERAREIDPALPGADLPLAVARFHQGDLAGAEAALDAAEAVDPDDAEVLLYRGVLLLSAGGDPAEAAARLARARSRDPAAVEPVASYYEGAAWLEAGEGERGRAALERVVAQAPDSDWARRAEAALSEEAGGPPLRWAHARVGWVYDDNVVLAGDGVQLPREISEQRDTAVVWSVEAGGELWRSESWTWGGLLRYDGIEYDDLDDFDSHYPVVTTWLDRSLGDRTTARVELDFGYGWLGDEPFLVQHRYSLALFHGWGRFGTTQAFARLGRFNYLFSQENVNDGPGVVNAPCLDPDDILCAPPGIDESRERNRDGNQTTVGFEQTVPLPNGFAWSGYRFRHFGARGSEYSFNSHGAVVGLHSRLPFGLVFDGELHYARRRYRNPSTFPSTRGLFLNRQYGLRSSRRIDHDFRVRLALGYPIGEHLLLEARWNHERNRSNVAVFDYRRHVIGMHLTLRSGS